jgi:hypothetical protein
MMVQQVVIYFIAFMKLRITNFSQIIYFLLYGTLPLCILEVRYDFYHRSECYVRVKKVDSSTFVVEKKKNKPMSR